MKFWSNIAIGLALAFGPVVEAVAAPLGSSLDVQQLCRYSQHRQSPFAQQSEAAVNRAVLPVVNADAVHSDAMARVPGSGDPNFDRHDPLTEALRARDYVETRGRVLMRDYQVSVQSSNFDFLPYDPEVGLLGLTFSPRASLFNGDVSAVWAEPQALYFEVSAEEAETLEALRATHSISIVATVHLVSREESQRPFCTQLADGTPQLELLLVDGEITATGTGERLHHAATERWERLSCQGQLVEPMRSASKRSASPNVRVVNVSSEGEGSMPNVEASMLRLLAETELHGCYMHALQQNAALQGALVVEFNFDEKGRVSSSGVLIDAANNSQLTRCTIQALESARIQRGIGASPLAVRMNLIFARY